MAANPRCIGSLGSHSFEGLGYFQFIAPEAGNYSLEGKISSPLISDGSSTPSSVIVEILINNFTNIYTGDAGAQGFKTNGYYAMAAGDTFDTYIQSFVDVDQGLNKVKSVISFNKETS